MDVNIMWRLDYPTSFTEWDKISKSTLRGQESVICFCLLHGCDVIRIVKLCTEGRGASRVLLCSLKMRMMSHEV